VLFCRPGESLNETFIRLSWSRACDASSVRIIVFGGFIQAAGKRTTLSQAFGRSGKYTAATTRDQQSVWPGITDRSKEHGRRQAYAHGSSGRHTGPVSNRSFRRSLLSFVPEAQAAT